MEEEQIDWITKLLFVVILAVLMFGCKNWFADLYKFFLKS